MSSTVPDLEANVRGALNSLPELRARGQLPQELEALALLSPGSFQQAEVALIYRNGRKVRADAGAHYWDLSVREVRIRMQPAAQGSTPAPSTDEPAPASTPAENVDPAVTIVKKLAEAELRGMPFIALKFLRDKLLPSEASWTQEPERRQAEVKAAIDRGLVLTSKVPNPKAPQFPTTAVRVNRADPLAQEVLKELSGFEEGFSPVAIRGRALSDTMLEDRR